MSNLKTNLDAKGPVNAYEATSKLPDKKNIFLKGLIADINGGGGLFLKV